MQLVGAFARVLLSAAVLVAPAAASSESTPVGGPPAGADARASAGVSAERIASLFDAATGGSDSCRAPWEEPFFYLWEWAQRRCEATRCELAQPSRIDAVAVAWFNYGAEPSEKNVRVFIMEDSNGLPGDVLWSIDATTTLLGAGQTASIVYPVDPPLDPIGPGPLWFGHEEIAAGPPSSLFDGAAQGANASSPPPCGAWEAQTLGDYVQTLPVSASEATGVGGFENPERRGAMRVDRLASPATSALRFDLVLERTLGVRCDLVTPSGERALAVLAGTPIAPGRHDIVADLRALPAGVYFLRLDAEGETLARKVLLVR